MVGSRGWWNGFDSSLISENTFRRTSGDKRTRIVLVASMLPVEVLHFCSVITTDPTLALDPIWFYSTHPSGRKPSQSTCGKVEERKCICDIQVDQLGSFEPSWLYFVEKGKTSCIPPLMLIKSSTRSLQISFYFLSIRNFQRLLQQLLRAAASMLMSLADVTV